MTACSSEIPDTAGGSRQTCSMLMSKKSTGPESAEMQARERQRVRKNELLEQAQNKDPDTVVFMDISIDGNPAGRIEFELDTVGRPITAENFRALCTGEKGIDKFCYRNSKFHRVISGFICQGGDIVNNNGMGGRSIYNFNKSNKLKPSSAFFDEVDFDSETINEDNVHDEWTLSMSNFGPDTNRSQFFICLKDSNDAEFLNNRHVVFGKVKKGKDVVAFINSKGTKSGMPTADIRIADCGQLS